MAKIAAAAAPSTPPPAQPAAPEPIKKKKKRSWIQLVGVVLLLLAASGGGAWYFIYGKADDAAVEKEKAPPKPLFESLEPFTVNLSDDTGDHYLQVGIVYHVATSQVSENMKLYMPILRNRLLLLLSAKRASELATVEGKKKLVDELVVAARDILPGTDPDKGVVTALLASFVIQ